MTRFLSSGVQQRLPCQQPPLVEQVDQAVVIGWYSVGIMALVPAAVVWIAVSVLGRHVSVQV